MTGDQRDHVLTTITRLKEWVQAQAGFLQDHDLKAIFVIVATCEGAIMFNDINEFAQLCADFAGRKAKDMDIESN